MSGFEVSGLVLGVTGIVPLFREGYKLVKGCCKRKLSSRERLDASTLSTEIASSKKAIEKKYRGFLDVYGHKYARGDGKFSHNFLFHLYLLAIIHPSQY